MKNAVANLADLLDRQMALLVDSRYSNGLPANLSGVEGPRAAINHGLKALQISVSAWTAEALKLTMPASVFSRSTECHNQDKVSMGTIAARDCLRVLELTEQVAAGLLITVRQGSLAAPQNQSVAWRCKRRSNRCWNYSAPISPSSRKTAGWSRICACFWNAFAAAPGNCMSRPLQPLVCRDRNSSAVF